LDKFYLSGVNVLLVFITNYDIKRIIKVVSLQNDGFIFEEIKYEEPREHENKEKIKHLCELHALVVKNKKPREHESKRKINTLCELHALMVKK